MYLAPSRIVFALNINLFTQNTTIFATNMTVFSPNATVFAENSTAFPQNTTIFSKLQLVLPNIQLYLPWIWLSLLQKWLCLSRVYLNFATHITVLAQNTIVFVPNIFSSPPQYDFSFTAMGVPNVLILSSPLIVIPYYLRQIQFVLL